MNLILGMIVRNESGILPLTLPVTRGVPTLKVALDFHSTDGTPDILRAHGWLVVDGGVWVNDYAAARNELLSVGRAFGLSSQWMLQLDADECMWSEDVDKVDATTRDVKLDLIALSRYNYAARGTLYETGSYPDPQTRVVRLGSDARYRLPVHEVIDGPRVHKLDAHIHHYGWYKSPQENWLRSHNYGLISKGEKSIDTPPDDGRLVTYEQWLADMMTRHTFTPVNHDHPLRGKL